MDKTTMFNELFAPQALSVSELNRAAAELLETGLTGLWVGGEVSNLSRAASGHYYFSLKDSHAQVRCVLFKFAARQASALREGDHIEVYGKISLYQARGEFQITVSDWRSQGLGQLYERFERLKQRLQAEGLFDAERKRSLPAYPQTVGVVSSLAAAALRDVVATLARRAPDVRVVVYPTAVQGAGSAAQIAAALRTANRRREADVLLLCRGGGSMEDLWSFNEEEVVRAVAESRVPLVCGVGHETDVTLADFAADVRAPTPTAAAELAAPDREGRWAMLAALYRRLQHAAHSHYRHAAHRLDGFAVRVVHPKVRLAAERQHVVQAAAALTAAFSGSLNMRERRLARQQQHLAELRPQTAVLAERLARMQTVLRQDMHQLLLRRQEEVRHQAAVLAAVSPQQVLARGFALITDGRGQIVRSSARLKAGQKLHMRLADGASDVQVLAAQGQGDLFDNSQLDG